MTPGQAKNFRRYREYRLGRNAERQRSLRHLNEWQYRICWRALAKGVKPAFLSSVFQVNGPVVWAVKIKVDWALVMEAKP